MTATLASLAPGKRAVIDGFVTIDAGVERLMHMGLLEGTPVEVIRRAPAGDPIEIRLLDYALSLRKEQAQNILITAQD